MVTTESAVVRMGRGAVSLEKGTDRQGVSVDVAGHDQASPMARDDGGVHHSGKGRNDKGTNGDAPGQKAMGAIVQQLATRRELTGALARQNGKEEGLDQHPTKIRGCDSPVVGGREPLRERCRAKCQHLCECAEYGTLKMF